MEGGSSHLGNLDHLHAPTQMIRRRIRRIGIHPKDGWDDVILERVPGVRRRARNRAAAVVGGGPRGGGRNTDGGFAASEGQHGRADGSQSRYGPSEEGTAAPDRLLLLLLLLLSHSPSTVVVVVIIFVAFVLSHPPPTVPSFLQGGRRSRRRRVRIGAVVVLGGQGHADGAGGHDACGVRMLVFGGVRGVQWLPLTEYEAAR
jgi:hypothetical protein